LNDDIFNHSWKQLRRLAHYQNFLHTQLIESIDTKRSKEKLEKQSKDEMNHAKEIIIGYMKLEQGLLQI
jgi:bacterioferritin (cytochrome b1)